MSDALTRDDALVLLDAHGDALPPLLERAVTLRDEGLARAGRPGVLTWVRPGTGGPAPLLRLHVEAPGNLSWTDLQWHRPGAAALEISFGPAVDASARAEVLAAAGRTRLPLTLALASDDPEALVDTLLAARAAHEVHGHLQAVTLDGTAPAAVAVTRLLVGADVRLTAPDGVAAGADDLGPLTDPGAYAAPDGFVLRERLAVHPAYVRAVRAGEDWCDDRLAAAVLALADDHGLARKDALHGRQPAAPPRPRVPTGLRRIVERAAADPAGLDDADYVALLHADGDDLEALAAVADAVRRERVGDAVTYAVNRNLDPSRGLPWERVEELVAEARDLGATEICAQGPVPPEQGAEGYLEFARAVKRAAPELHLHAFRPAETLDGARRAGTTLTDWLAQLRTAGVDTVPGTAARILDDAIRSALTAGTDIPAAAWVDAVTSAHRSGLRSTATMVYGHVESAADQVRHLRTLARLQDETGGFTEFIPMPFLPSESPVPVPGARPGPSLRESRAVHAVARLVLAGRIDHVQAAWTKLGLRGAQLVLQGGADDLGGVLLDGVLDPSAGPEAGRQLGREDVVRLAAEIGRPVRQRTTVYAEVTARG